jgi:signal transduction histidine kinase
MSSDTIKTDNLSNERRKIIESGKLHRVHWIIIALSLAVTIGVWQYAKSQARKDTEIQFKYAARQVLELMSEQMQKYELGLWAGVAMVQTQGGSVTGAEWKQFSDNLRIDRRYPAINGIGIIDHLMPSELDEYLKKQQKERPNFTVYPNNKTREYFPVTHIEPAGDNENFVGLDMAREENRHTAALQAGKTGKAQITAPITLDQDTDGGLGFLFYAPFNRGDHGGYGNHGENSPNQDRSFGGFIFAPFLFDNLIDGALAKDRRQVQIAVRDGDTLLYDEHIDGGSAFDPTSPFSITMDLILYGRTWRFNAWATPEFADALTHKEPTIILLAGICLDFLLVTLFTLLTKSNRRAINFADRVAQSLKTKSDALQKSNSELEKFAYVASHDLKTPLRGIGDLTEYLEDDLSPYLGHPDANPDVAKNLSRLHQQVNRMNALINSVLKYSSIGSDTASLQLTNMTELVLNITTDLGLNDNQLIVKGTLPTIATDYIRLHQVFSNLIGNAVKYHDGIRKIRILIEIVEGNEYFSITVTDNGPGINKEYHSKIFEIFQTLQTQDEIESTGIGLAIVKKSVEIYGGRVFVTSEVGSGTSFTFDWPKEISKPTHCEAA